MQTVILERTLNYLLETHQIDVSLLDGKVVYFSLQDLPIEVSFVCTNARIFVTTDANTTTDVDIKLKSSVFLALLQGEELTKLLREDKIIIHGDVKTAQLLVDLLQQVDIDFEEELSKYTGDMVAHQVGKLAKKFKSSDNPLTSIKDKITTLLIRPKVQ
ncbi:Protein YigP (COG3165) clustered with ubiquinone biosynthetic genes [Bathymodiolus heckerae thiotrophic gill symbiont]|uniref:ubiquinone biosynthesis accessory factor UbiJ n=1 Tax=Bathymodiolus heckerae thiotrophic gill symbiont TaxID=1052212 RepID=UPI0010B625D9|nr:SCP2 sterol-binding domain-containing protein [Bathymodiolus heckerae thiotrophic gill symbiont]SMN13226.1 Protein YigP (COG3165) clustered with ubiquinone biosynthetic genes [Bathymodiolus heckerae thiotrophic gill symbiont]SMN14337.1 Protein YigP (COG3165) clustered with ubiquinone biosynthetic genes [uncultured Candidatus Thioglobus sp.]